VAQLHVPTSGLSSTFGAWMAGAGVACAAFGGYRYVVSARALRAGATAPLSNGGAVISSIGVGIIIGLIVAFALPTVK
jgi:uncharacterized membrane protein YidH (DUF202 family)